MKLLPPNIDFTLLVSDISNANREIGKLDGKLNNLPNYNLLISPLLTKESVASSQIEGTQATVEDVYKYEAEGKTSENNAKEQDIKEIINYRKAVQIAVDELSVKPIGENFLKKMHLILMDSVRGHNKNRGSFRTAPVFIGKPGSTISEAIYVPPDSAEIKTLISNWEKFVHSDDMPDAIAQIAIAHYQFEAIHPFLDGNGRIGRLLIPMMLFEKKLISYPMLYISEYFEKNKEEYYYYLRLVDKEQKWEEWIKYFLKAIVEQARFTQTKIDAMNNLYKDTKDKLNEFNSVYSVNLLDIIFENPIVTFKKIKHQIKTDSYQTIFNLLKKFEQAHILTEITGSKRNKIYIFNELLDIVK